MGYNKRDRSCITRKSIEIDRIIEISESLTMQITRFFLDIAGRNLMFLYQSSLFKEVTLTLFKLKKKFYSTLKVKI